MKKLGTRSLGALAVMACALPMNAGGLWVLVGSPDAGGAGAYATVKMAGCHEPEKARITAFAIGEVNGERRRIALKLTPLKEAGSYALQRQWPAEGRWVLQLSSEENGVQTSTLVVAGRDGVERAGMRQAMKPPAEADLEALLRPLASQTAAR